MNVLSTQWVYSHSIVAATLIYDDKDFADDLYQIFNNHIPVLFANCKWVLYYLHIRI